MILLLLVILIGVVFGWAWALAALGGFIALTFLVEVML